MFQWTHAAQVSLERQLFSQVDAPAFPCVGAKAALARGTLQVLACSRIDSAWDDVRIHEELLRFSAAYRAQPTLFRSLAIVFEGPDDLSEQQFEQSAPPVS
jgi:FPC/CPF motif-containing protein YcgG